MDGLASGKGDNNSAVTSSQVLSQSHALSTSSPSSERSQPTIQTVHTSNSISMAVTNNAAVIASKMGSPSSAPQPVSVLDRRRIEELVKEVDSLEQMDDDVEDMLMQIADDFIDNVVSAACQLAKHRKSNTVEVKDVQMHLERCWNMWIPGFGSEELKPYKKSATTEAHKQRLSLIKKTLKKY
ncbi:hypothetical protein LSH36_1037g00069 [Paralvinella palmiformis]|uniref:Transcription initiation factor TFIID subunit 12 n=1 Tax=Paralvinella palmiformis TaxID=53620 RepID=A0AAD9MQL3_9ANNE|nr:hypothetical protein LSH36_1037g00069 [Paralvinella palmiformis]